MTSQSPELDLPGLPSPTMWLGGLIILLVFIALARAVFGIAEPPLIADLIGSLFIVGALFGAAARARRADTFMYTGFYAGTFAFFLSVPLLAPAAMEPNLAERTHEVFGWTVLLTVVGFEAAYWWRARSAEARQLPFVMTRQAEQVLYAFVYVGLALWIVDVIQFARHFQISVLTVLLTLRGTFGDAPTPVPGIYAYIRGLLQAGIYVSATAAATILIAGPRRGYVRRTTCWLVLVACVVVGFLGGSRSQLLYAIAPLGATSWILLSRSRITPLIRFGLGGVALVMLIAAWVAMSALRGSDIRNFDQTKNPVNPLRNAREAFDVSSTAGQVVELVPGTIPFQQGASLVPVVLGWVPRALWPAKPYPFTNSLNDAYYETIETRSASLAVGLAGEGYANFGMLGALLWGGLLALWAQFLDRGLGRLNEHHPLRLQFAIMGAIWIAMMVRGGVAEMFYMGLLTLAPPAVLVWYLQKRAEAQ
jgi:hypothetical protein